MEPSRGRGISKDNKMRIINCLAMLVIAIVELIGFVRSFSNNKFGMLVFYTQDSNLILLVVALIYVLYSVINRNREIPKWILLAKYIATCLVTVTLITVMFVLAPMYAPAGGKIVLWLFVGGANLYHHVLGPIFAIAAFLALEKEYVPAKKDALLAAVPTLVYAIVTALLNALYILHGPYPFLYVHEQPLWMSVMWFVLITGMAYLLALALRAIKKKSAQKSRA